MAEKKEKLLPAESALEQARTSATELDEDSACRQESSSGSHIMTADVAAVSLVDDHAARDPSSNDRTTKKPNGQEIADGSASECNNGDQTVEERMQKEMVKQGQQPAPMVQQVTEIEDGVVDGIQAMPRRGSSTSGTDAHNGHDDDNVKSQTRHKMEQNLPPLALQQSQQVDDANNGDVDQAVTERIRQGLTKQGQQPAPRIAQVIEIEEEVVDGIQAMPGRNITSTTDTSVTNSQLSHAHDDVKSQTRQEMEQNLPPLTLQQSQQVNDANNGDIVQAVEERMSWEMGKQGQQQQPASSQPSDVNGIHDDEVVAGIQSMPSTTTGTSTTDESIKIQARQEMAHRPPPLICGTSAGIVVSHRATAIENTEAEERTSAASEQPRPPTQVNVNNSGVQRVNDLQEEVMDGIQALPSAPSSSQQFTGGGRRRRARQAGPGAFAAGRPGTSLVAVQAPRYSLFGRLTQNHTASSQPRDAHRSTDTIDEEAPNGDSRNVVLPTTASGRIHSSQLVVADPVSRLSSSLSIQKAEEIDKPAGDEGITVQRKLTKRILIQFAGLAVLVLVAVVVLLAVFVRNNKSSNDEIMTESPATSAPTQAPTYSSSISLFSLFSDDTNFRIVKEGTPQNDAFQWLVRDPDISEYPDWRIQQRFALATLYFATEGKRWHNNTHWLNYSHHECEWYASFIEPKFINGLAQGGTLIEILQMDSWERELFLGHLNHTVCEDDEDPHGTSNNTEREYRHLRLFMNNLRGTIPPEIYMLTSLRSISFFTNHLEGSTISTLIGDLRQLECLDLLNLDIEGSIPTEIGLLSNLIAVWAMSNQITGAIPSEIGQLTNLREVMAEDNKLNSTIPTEIGMLSNMKRLALDYTSLTGSIPTEIGQMTAMEGLRLHDTDISGVIPTEMGMLTSLSRLYLFEMPLVGSIPSEAGLWGPMEDLQIHSTKISGAIPTEIGMMTGMTHLHLFNMSLEGTLPSELGRLSLVKELAIDSVEITGVIPTEIGLMTSMIWLYLFDMPIEGSLPSELGALDQVAELVFCFTDITGNIPTEIGKMTNTSVLYLFETHLDGSIPSELGLLVSMTDLQMHSTNIAGPLPTEFGAMTGLEVLYLNDTGLTGSIPSELGLCSNLQYLRLDGNSLNGPFVTELGQCSSLIGLNVSSNSMSSQIPSEFGLLGNLSDLDLSSNPFNGSVPEELAELAIRGSLSVLNISSTEVSGSIPPGLCVPRVDLTFDCSESLCGCGCKCRAFN